MDAIIKALLYVILFLAIVTVNVWFVRAVSQAYLREQRPLVIAPFQVIGKDDAGGKQGTALASMLLARLARIRQEMEASEAALRARPEREVAPTIQTLEVSGQTSLSIPERLFAPLNINMTVGGVEVGGILSWAQRVLSRDETLQIAVQYEADRAVAVTHLEGSSEYSLWIESQGSSEQVVSAIAYALTQRQFARRIAEVEALDATEFRTLLSTLNRAAELNRQVARGRAARDSYATLLPQLEGLAEKAPRWKALLRLTAEIAENSGEASRAVALYKRELALTDDRDGRRDEIRTRMDRLAEQITATATAPPAPPPAGGTAPPTPAPAKWLLDMLGVEPRPVAGMPLLAVLGDPPPAGSVPPERMEVIRVDAKPPARARDDMTDDYMRTVVQAVQFVAPDARFGFAPIGLEHGAARDSLVLPAFDAVIRRKPAVLLVTIGPLQGRVYERVYQSAVAAGILVVIAAGNDAGTPVPFADSPLLKDIMVVGSVDRKGQRSRFTQYARGVFWAPGENLAFDVRPGRQETRAGTSYSAAVAAGLAVRLLAERPGLPVKTLLDTLRETSTPPTPGAEPVLNLAAALSRLPPGPRS